MDAKKFKETYLQWSKSAIISVVCILYAIGMCDYFLGFDFLENMYMMSFIATGCLLAFLSISWISVLNLESRFLKKWSTSVIDDEVTLEDIAQFVKSEGYLPEIDEQNNAINFKIQGDAYTITYNEHRFSLYKHYNVDADVIDIDLLVKAIDPTQENMFGVKVSFQEYEDGNKVIFFQFSSLYATISEIQRHFTRCLNILNSSVGFHRETYAKLEERRKTTRLR